MTAPILVYGEDWGGLPSSTQHLIRHLLPDHPVVWVNSLGLRRPRFCRRDLGRLGRKLLAASALPTQRETGKPSAGPGRSGAHPNAGAPARIISPLCLPVPRNGLERWINRQLVGPKIKQALQDLASDGPIIWASLPTAIDLLDLSPREKVVYYCGDDFGGLAGVDHAPVLAAEARLVERADLVLAASPILAHRFPAEKTLYLPHGVDFDLFSTPQPRPLDLPSGKPIAGFYGSLSSWLDCQLLSTVAQTLPDWDFVFIGKTACDLGDLQRFANVHLLGPRDHTQLPGYAQHWQASLLPFLDTAQIRACNPLKLREYMAAGQPIVATPFPALKPYQDMITVADSPKAFTQALINAGAEGQTRVSERRACIQGETWRARSQQVSAALADLSR